jgi:AraC-like DNA-binding protein
MWKKIGIGLLVALLLVGGITGAVVAANVIQEGPIDDLFAKFAQRLGLSRKDMLQELLDGKTLQDVMEDQGLSREDVMGDWQMKFVRRPKQPFFKLEDIAEVLGMEPEALRDAFAEGQTLADVVESQGLDKEDVLADLIAFTEDKIKTAQDAGDITDEQAEKLLERFQDADIGTDWMDKVPVGHNFREGIMHRIREHPGIILEDIAAALGMEPAELREAFADGQTLGEIIESQGLDEDQVYEDVKAAIVARFEGVVEDKEAALKRAEKILEKMKEGDFGGAMWEKMLDWEGPRPRMPMRDNLPWRTPRMQRP